MDQKKLIKLAEKGGDDKDLLFLEEIAAVNNRVDSLGVEIRGALADLNEGLKKKLEERFAEELSYEIDREEIRGDKGDNYILTDADKSQIASQVASQIKVPVVEKVIEKTETIRELPTVTEIVKNITKEVAVGDTPEQVTQKINVSPLLIKATKIEGFSDLERIAKANAFNPTLGPSFSDLATINKRIDPLIIGVNTDKITVSSTEPDNPSEGDLWVDTS